MTRAVENSPGGRFDEVIGRLLLAGVLGSIGLIAAGLAWRWFNTGRVTMDYQIPATNLVGFWLRDLRDSLAGHWRPRLLVNLGIALLMATPYARVLVSTFHFAFVQRNAKYTVFTLFVLGFLTYALFFGRV